MVETGDPGETGGNQTLAPLATAFRFAIVGDTRPAGIDGTSHYPTAVITKIWSDIQAESPRPSFAVTTGDYMFARTTGTQAATQMNLYLTARNQFANPVYYALGNHECTGATNSNCGAHLKSGIPSNYQVFLDQMMKPLGFQWPYYVVNFHDSANTWTAKVVVIAGNSWSPAQATWLDQELAKPTTYTFVVRHESNTATTAPGVSPSHAIVINHPYTLMIVGHEHTYKHNASEHEIVVGTGGAPLVGGVNYGYGVVERLANGTIQFTMYDYMSHAVVDKFAVHPDGSPA